ncbi:MAG: ABC transporter permease, partial [Truepera sp.]|nr:ABC transporter permease [Truepera sp.]
MNRPVSRFAIIAAIIRKDLLEFSRDRLWMILTPLTLVMFTAIFWLMPYQVEETVTVGVAPGALGRALELLGSPGLRLVAFDSEAELAAAVAGEQPDAPPLSIGLAFPEDFLLQAARGQPATVRVYVDALVPPEVRHAMTSAVREVAYTLSGAPLPVSLAAEEVVLGTDRLGQQIPLRERFRPLLAFLVLMVEALALASLIAAEVSSRTIAALLVTPVRSADILAAKGLLGTVLAFAQAFLLLLVTHSLGGHTAALLLAVLLGALLVSGIGLYTGAAGKDFIGTLFLGALFMFP